MNPGKKRLRKAQQSASGTAVFLLLLAVLIIAYILVMTPEQRASLLGGDIPGGTGQNGLSGGKTMLLDEKIGRLDYLKFDERTHELSSFRIFTTTQAQVIKTEPSVYVKNSITGEKIKQVPFSIEHGLSKNLLLSFNVKKSMGRLMIYLNGREIFNDELIPSSPPPIRLSKDYLRDSNVLEFRVSDPGWFFWRINEYTLTDLIVAGDVSDLSASSGTQTFQISDTEKQNLEKAVLWFLPDCKDSTSGLLTCRINSRVVFEGAPDCGVRSHIDLDVDLLREGENTIYFGSTGQVLIDQVKITTELEDLLYPVYYFEIDDSYFKKDTTYSSKEEYCGNIDGKCPAGCDEDADKDCCFEESNDNYWCDVETDYADDRCISYPEINILRRCPSGYEDRDGDAAENVICGDDNDGLCPAGCSIYYDKDCCLSNENNYWCDDLPKTGASSICESDVSSGECDDCPSGYYNDDGNPSCGSSGDDDDESGVVLKKEYDVNLTMTFPDTRENHKADIIINGRTTYVDTKKAVYSRMIDDYVQSETNSIEIVPRASIDIVRLTIQLQKH